MIGTFETQEENNRFNEYLKKREVESHTVQIVCPECRHGQVATVEHTFPWYTYLHTCTNCKYLIMESEWNEVESEIKPKKI